MSDEIKITSIKMPFWNMVWFIVKWTLASIVAIAILAIMFMLAVMLIAMISGEGANIDSTISHFSSQFGYHHSVK